LLTNIYSFKKFIRPRDLTQECLKFYQWTFFNFPFLSIYCAQQPRSGCHRMYSGGSAVGKASTILV